jgi:subtilisin family serine protease
MRDTRVSLVLAVAWSIGLALAAPADRAGAQTILPPGSPAGAFADGELIVRLTEGGSGAKLMALFTRLGVIDIKSFDTVEGLYLVKLPQTLGVLSAVQLAKELDGVAYAEPNYLLRTQVLPNDPSFGTLWGLNNTGQLGGTADADIDAPEAWDITTGSSNVVVVVIDTGIDYTHPDLVANMFRNETDCNTNGIDDDGNKAIDDCHGLDTVNRDGNPLDDHDHGTHVAGTIGATGNNGTGVVGVNWSVKLMACKFLNAAGSGSTADAVACLDYVALMKDRGVNIVATNNSWGGSDFSQALVDAIDAQRQRGILFIAAAGNDASDNDTSASFPANTDLPNVIAVAATTRTDTLSDFSNLGRRLVHLGAPGSAILSTTRNDSLSTFNGTSMATPHVTGVVALLKAQDPNRDWRALRNLILAGGDNNANLAAATVTGKRLNAAGSLTCSGSTVFSRLKPIQNTVTTTVGTPISLSALSINCAAGAGNVAVTVSPGTQVTLTDGGTGTDQAAGDGVYAGTFAPASAGLFVLTFPNSETVIVKALSATSYTAQPTGFAYRQITGTNLNLADDTSASISSPFPLFLGGASFKTLFVSSNGNVNVTAALNAYANTAIPTTVLSAPLIAPFWDDLVASGSGQNVFWAVTGSAPARELVIEWRNVTAFTCNSAETVTFQVVFFEGRGDLLFNYADVNFGGSCAFRDGGASATIGLQSSPAVSRQFSFNSPGLSDGLALSWTLTTGLGATAFTDDPLIAASTTIKAIHIIELRSRANAVRARFGLSAVAWIESSLNSTTTKAAQLTELRTALGQAYTAAGQSAPLFTDPTLAQGNTVVKVVHVKELRDAVIALEAS